MSSVEYQHFRLRRDQLVIGVDSHDPTLRQWLGEFFSPAFAFDDVAVSDHRSESPGFACSRWHISVICNPKRYAAMLADGPQVEGQTIECATNDGDFVSYPLWDRQPPSTTVFLATYRCFCKVDLGDRYIDVLHGHPRARPRLAVMRVIREIATTHHLRLGHVPVHASAFTTEDGAVAVVGVKRSGKTSMLINATLRNGARYLTNDRLYLRLDGGRAIASGMPTIASIRPPTFRLFPEIGQRYAQLGYRKETTLSEATESRRCGEKLLQERALLTPAQFCDLLQAEAASSAALSQLIFPTIVPHAHRSRTWPLSAAEAGHRLFENLFRGSSPMRIAELFCQPGEQTPISDFELRRQCHEIAKRVPGFRCELGRDAYEQSSTASQWRRAA